MKKICFTFIVACSFNLFASQTDIDDFINDVSQGAPTYGGKQSSLEVCLRKNTTSENYSAVKSVYEQLPDYLKTSKIKKHCLYSGLLETVFQALEHDATDKLDSIIKSLPQKYNDLSNVLSLFNNYNRIDINEFLITVEGKLKDLTSTLKQRPSAYYATQQRSVLSLQQLWFNHSPIVKLFQGRFGKIPNNSYAQILYRLTSKSTTITQAKRRQFFDMLEKHLEFIDHYMLFESFFDAVMLIPYFQEDGSTYGERQYLNLCQTIDGICKYIAESGYNPNFTDLRIRILERCNTLTNGHCESKEFLRLYRKFTDSVEFSCTSRSLIIRDCFTLLTAIEPKKLLFAENIVDHNPELLKDLYKNTFYLENPQTVTFISMCNGLQAQ